MFACTVYVYFILVIVSFKSSVELVCIVYNAPNLNKAFEKKKKRSSKNGCKIKRIKNITRREKNYNCLSFLDQILFNEKIMIIINIASLLTSTK